jgi:hypothetical protein
MDLEIASPDIKSRDEDQMAPKEEEKEEEELEEKLPKKIGRKIVKVKGEEVANRDKMMGTQTIVDKSLASGIKPTRTLGSSVPLRGGDPKPSSK